MAWHSGKPADNDTLAASAKYIRENFAELEPLHQHADELIDLTALQPHASELVDLLALHPYISVLLSSRIVDHNLTAVDPPGGWYVRWQNGLQIIMAQVTVDTTADTAHMYTAPAAFRTNTPKHATYSFVSLTSAANRNSARAVVGVGMTLGTPTTYYVATDGTGTVAELPVHVAIVGLW